MATKIFYNDNRIIIDGHADTPTECQAITAMCDSLANDENFKTIVYEKGHAVFERIDGGDAMMFTMQKYVLELKYNTEVGENYPSAYGPVKDRLLTLENQLYGVDIQTGILADALGLYAYGRDYINAHGSIASRLDALEAKLTKTLPFTADELIAKLESI